MLLEWTGANDMLYCLTFMDSAPFRKQRTSARRRGKDMIYFGKVILKVTNFTPPHKFVAHPPGLSCPSRCGRGPLLTVLVIIRVGWPVARRQRVLLEQVHNDFHGFLELGIVALALKGTYASTRRAGPHTLPSCRA